MAICDFCLKNIFQQDWQAQRVKKDHHRGFASWEISVEDSCVICTLLLEHLRTAVQELEGKAAKQELVTPGKATDKEIRDTEGEKLLVEWFKKTEHKLELSYPLYKTHIQDAGGREAWRVEFQPVVGSLRCNDSHGALRTQKFLVYAADYDGDAGVKQGLLAPSTGSVQTINQIKAWDKDCRESHPACKGLHRERQKTDWVPTRLIHVGDKKSPPRLVETGGQVSDRFKRYITLSYVWGYEPEPINLLTHDNYNQLISQMEEEKMPQTFQDAISTTRRLGIDYLWIDALCLLQQDAEEWLRESPLMHEVYGNATLSLAAVSGMNNEQGLYRKRSTRGASPATVSVQWTGSSLDCLVVREDFWQGEILSEPLYRRGWCLQERVLAPRLLHFQRRQVYWQCPSLTASEALPQGLSTIMDDERREEMRWRQSFHRRDPIEKLGWLEEVEMHEFWRLTVASYTRCNLTKPTDKLMAIASIAGKMQKDFRIISHDAKPPTEQESFSYDVDPPSEQEAYYVGIWKRGFVQQLAWKVNDWRSAAGRSDYRAPSWTWASVDGAVMPPARTVRQQDYEMEVWEPNGISLQFIKPRLPTGPVHFGSLTGLAALYTMEFNEPRSEKEEWVWAGAKDELSGGLCRLALDQRFEDLSFEAGNTEDVNISGERGSRTLRCTVVMLFYVRDVEAEAHDAKFSGSGLAVRLVSRGTVKMYSRFGLVEFWKLGGNAWTKLQSYMEDKGKKQGEIAPADDLPANRFIITIL